MKALTLQWYKLKKSAWLKPRNSVIAIPYLWLLLFFLVPFVIVLKISFAEAQIAIPPYTDLITLPMTSSASTLIWATSSGYSVMIFT